MKIIRVVYFTDNGKKIAEKLNKDFILEEKPATTELKTWTGDTFALHLPILFIGSTGIAVRTIAPFVENKLTDSPVIVVDELGMNVIPILSGHYGGANELAKEIAQVLDATPIITTATDINNVFAIDVFAEKNGLRIQNKDQIKKVSSKLLKQETVVIKNEIPSIIFEGDQPENVELFTNQTTYDVLITDKEKAEDCLVLIPNKIILGMGCKKDKPFEELIDFVKKHYVIEDLKKDIYAITSIDVKANEPGLLKLAAYLDTWLITFPAEDLQKATGNFTTSDFVKQTVGVDNVSERSAVTLGGTLTRKKIAENGMTLAEAVRDIRSFVW
ncbi:MAG: cobalamin biosynthesis protein [Pseudobutyrivibrio sp.]|nr:cobalamin biosynthesis protein [Pseudobutyrivibrio sp.]